MAANSISIELCSQCLKPINKKTEAYYTGVRQRDPKDIGAKPEVEQYYLHPDCFKAYMTWKK